MKTVITITGPSAGGKSTLERKLEETGLFGRVISTTTRPIREGETDGIDYHFVTESEFQWRVDANEFLDHKRLNGGRYGATFGAFMDIFMAEKTPVIVVEPVGAKHIKKFGEENGWRVINVFVDGALGTLVDRFMSRMTRQYIDENREYVAERLANLVLTEKLDWSNFMKWDISMTRFDEGNEHDVVDTIRSIVLAEAS